jgi:hypothetical protein
MEEIKVKVAGVEGLTSIPMRAELVAVVDNKDREKHPVTWQVRELYRVENGFVTVRREMAWNPRGAEDLEMAGSISRFTDAAELKDNLVGTGGLPSEWGWEPSPMDRKLFEAARAAGIDFGDEGQPTEEGKRE